MNITKKQWTIIGIVVAIILVWYFFLRKKPTESNFRRDGGPPSSEGKCPAGQAISVVDGRCHNVTIIRD